jgi:hypothetical protein
MEFGLVDGERSRIDQNFSCVLSSACFMNFIISSPSSFILFLLTNNKLICQKIKAPISTTIIARNILFFLKSSLFNHENSSDNQRLYKLCPYLRVWYSTCGINTTPDNLKILEVIKSQHKR